MSENNVLRQSAFEQGNKLLKGCLHCHTTISDGQLSPEDTQRAYDAKGYDFLAITDHRVYNKTNHAPDTDVLIIPAMEFDARFYFGELGSRTYHTVCLGPDDETNGFEEGIKYESGTGKVSDQTGFQEYLDWIHSNNNMTFYCHPEWSGTPTRYFDKLKGNFAMEIWNTISAVEYEIDTNASYWDEMLGLGHKLWGVAVDDTHAERHLGKGWVTVNAEKNVKSILSALKEGKFYSSCGPEINDFYVKDGKAYIECSPVSKIFFCSDAHPAEKKAAAPGENLTSAEFDMVRNCEYRGDYSFIRATVVDENGNRAWTNPIFIN